MKRDTLLTLLKEFIPSFHREWSGFGGTCDENDKYGFLYKDEYIYYRKPDGTTVSKSLPFFIPDGFLTEKTVVNKNDILDRLISVPPRKKDGKIVIGMTITSFAGYGLYEHTYGTLNIPAPRWAKIVNPTTIVSGSLRDYSDSRDFDPRIGSPWKTELCRIITKEDINSRANWDGWDAGDANQRFVSISEMFLTACWVSLARVGSPFILRGTESYVCDSNKDLLSVNEKGEVLLYDFFFRNIPPSKYQMFKD